MLGSAEAIEIVGHGLRLVAMLLNRVVERGGAPIVEQFRACSDILQRRRAQFVGGFLATGLHNAVTGAHVVKKEVAIWMNDLVA